MTRFANAIASVPVPYMQDGVKNYLLHGIPPGGFLTALLSNDLKGAFGRADATNLQHMEAWVRWLYSHCPAIAQGSPEIVAAWCKHRQGQAPVQ